MPSETIKWRTGKKKYKRTLIVSFMILILFLSYVNAVKKMRVFPQKFMLEAFHTTPPWMTFKVSLKAVEASPK